MRDRYGLELSTSSEAAAEAYVDGLDLFFALQSGAADRLSKAVELDEEWAAPHAPLAVHRILEADIGGAQEALTRGRTLRANPRESGHLDIVAGYLTADFAGTSARARQHLEDHPRDAFALQASSVTMLLQGRSAENVAFMESQRNVFGEDWVFLGSLGFALHEVRRLDDSETVTLKALDQRPDDASAAHSLAHVFFERGDHDGALTFSTASRAATRSKRRSTATCGGTLPCTGWPRTTSTECSGFIANVCRQGSRRAGRHWSTARASFGDG